MRKALPLLKKTLFYTILVIVCFEVALWILGYRPYENVDYKVHSEPENAFSGDAELGIKLNPGTYEITLNDSVQFTTTHLENNQRFIPAGPELPDSLETQIRFMGCSFTYGYGVNNTETFAALTQQSFPGIKVNNYGVVGYGTVHSLLQLREMDDLDKDDLVLLCFSSFHFMRNSLSQEYRSRLKIGFENSSKNLKNDMELARFPMLEDCGADLQFVSWKDMYDNWAGRETFASVNFIQSLRDRYLDSKKDLVEITTCLIEELHLICQSKGAQLAIICLDEDNRTIKLKENLAGIPWLDIQFDFGNPEITNLPYDRHPNALGHQYIHHKIEPFVSEILAK